jgi:hypothetical protein
VTVKEELETEDPATKQLQKHADNLVPEVFAIQVSLEGKLLSTSNNPRDDDALCPFYPLWKQLNSQKMFKFHRGLTYKNFIDLVQW